MTPLDKIPLWRGNAAKRVLDSMRFLGVHGFMTNTERQKVNRRFKRWLMKHEVEVVPARSRR